mmetsp:Transcript_94451/g.243951  ORF Transcript_94451/g.243951 Transcript_94451/m.243951 type:complete len:232 (-) Transcript_94451:550-1245(-)
MGSSGSFSARLLAILCTISSILSFIFVTAAGSFFSLRVDASNRCSTAVLLSLLPSASTSSRRRFICSGVTAAFWRSSLSSSWCRRCRAEGSRRPPTAGSETLPAAKRRPAPLKASASVELIAEPPPVPVPTATLSVAAVAAAVSTATAAPSSFSLFAPFFFEWSHSIFGRLKEGSENSFRHTACMAAPVLASSASVPEKTMKSAAQPSCSSRSLFGTISVDSHSTAAAEMK